MGIEVPNHHRPAALPASVAPGAAADHSAAAKPAPPPARPAVPEPARRSIRTVALVHDSGVQLVAGGMVEKGKYRGLRADDAVSLRVQPDGSAEIVGLPAERTTPHDILRILGLPASAANAQIARHVQATLQTVTAQAVEQALADLSATWEADPDPEIDIPARLAVAARMRSLHIPISGDLFRLVYAADKGGKVMADTMNAARQHVAAAEPGAGGLLLERLLDGLAGVGTVMEYAGKFLLGSRSLWPQLEEIGRQASRTPQEQYIASLMDDMKLAIEGQHLVNIHAAALGKERIIAFPFLTGTGEYAPATLVIRTERENTGDEPSGMGRSSFRLYLELQYLGRVVVSGTASGVNVTVIAIAQNEAAADALWQERLLLTEHLTAMGLNVRSVKVVTMAEAEVAERKGSGSGGAGQINTVV